MEPANAYIIIICRSALGVQTFVQVILTYSLTAPAHYHHTLAAGIIEFPNQKIKGETLMSIKTEQEQFWDGEFGDEYTRRNRGERWIASNTALFSRILRSTRGISSVIEFGANIGLNLIAIKKLIPECECAAVEINQTAVLELKKRLPHVETHHKSIFDFSPNRIHNFAFTKGVLIHINPDMLPVVYDRLYKSSDRYILICEYFNPKPVEVPYRGHSGKLFKRDFAGELLDAFHDLRLVDYGFVYHRDSNFPQDDLTWFLLEK